MQFDLVSPERSLASFEASSVQVPGTDGDMTVMDDHTPTITTLRPGLVKVEANGNEHAYVVTGGFAEIGLQGVSVLAEQAIAKSDVTQDILNAMLEEAKASVGAAKGNEKVDAAAKYLADITAIGSQIGLSV